MPKKQKTQAPDPFEVDHTKAVFSDRPAMWSDEAPSVWMFRIHWFSSEVDPIQLTGCVIRRLTNGDIEAMRGAEEEWPSLGLRGLMDAVAPAAEPTDPPEEEDIAQAIRPIPSSALGDRAWYAADGIEMPWFLVVEAPPSPYVDAHMYANRLRFATEICLGIVGGKHAFMTDATFFQEGLRGSLEGQYGLVDPETDDIPDDIKLQFTDDLVIPLQTVHTAALATKDDRLRVALKRFRRASEGGGDDRLIDYWIGLEALFGDRKGEITHKAAMRIAWYVGTDSKSRARWFKGSKKSYNTRSDMVHGNHPRDIRAARETAGEGLRLALLKALTEGALPSTADIDVSLIRRARRES